jgi:phage terminase Nu1 subunit (DNA packaging protein)
MVRGSKEFNPMVWVIPMTNAAPCANSAKPDRERSVADDVVTANSLATHLGCTRQNIARLTAETVLVQRADGAYDQTANRLRYIKHLRENYRSTPRSKADAEHIAVKTRMLQSKLDERDGKLISAEDAAFRMTTLVGTFIAGLSGFPARCAGKDLALRRALDRAVLDLRTEIGGALNKLGDADNEPPLEKT